MTTVEDDISTSADQLAVAIASMDTRTISTGNQIWAGFTSWYSAGAVAAVAAESAAASAASQQMSTGIAHEFMAAVLRAMGIIPRGAVASKLIRGGIDLRDVYKRPAAEYRREFALTGDSAKAAEAALSRLERLLEDDAMLARRQASQDLMSSSGVKLYRRIIRPERSITGTCGLCVVAADRIYKVRTLMPIHDRCKCQQLPIHGDFDPGLTLNEADLQQMYKAAGGSSPDKLKRIRIRQHGELGPVLTNPGHSFKGPRDLDDDPARAQQMLDKLRPVLDQLVARNASGEDLTEPLRYQRGLIARLEAITTK